MLNLWIHKNHNDHVYTSPQPLLWPCVHFPQTPAMTMCTLPPPLLCMWPHFPIASDSRAISRGCNTWLFIRAHNAEQTITFCSFILFPSTHEDSFFGKGQYQTRCIWLASPFTKNFSVERKNSNFSQRNNSQLIFFKQCQTFWFSTIPLTNEASIKGKYLYSIVSTITNSQTSFHSPYLGLVYQIHLVLFPCDPIVVWILQREWKLVFDCLVYQQQQVGFLGSKLPLWSSQILLHHCHIVPILEASSHLAIKSKCHLCVLPQVRIEAILPCN